MATKSKEELLAEAKELGLDLSEDNSVAEIKESIKNAKAEGSDQEAASEESALAGGAGDGREPQIADEPEEDFDARTGAGTPPWMNEDGSQNNG